MGWFDLELRSAKPVVLVHGDISIAFKRGILPVDVSRLGWLVLCRSFGCRCELNAVDVLEVECKVPR